MFVCVCVIHCCVVTVIPRIVNAFEEMAVEFVQDPSFPLNTPTIVEADNMALTTVKVPSTFIHCTIHHTHSICSIHKSTLTTVPQPNA